MYSGLLALIAQFTAKMKSIPRLGYSDEAVLIEFDRNRKTWFVVFAFLNTKGFIFVIPSVNTTSDEC